MNDGTIIQIDSNWSQSLYSTVSGGKGGIFIHGDTLYATAGTQGFVAFDLVADSMIISYHIPNQQGLNDCTVDTAGNLYIQDSQPGFFRDCNPQHHG